MHQQLIRLTVIIILSCLSGSSALAWDAATGANVLVFHDDGELAASYHLDDWTTYVTEDKVTVLQWLPGSPPDFSEQTIAFSLNSGDVALPNILNAASTAPAAVVPPVSMYTFDQAIFSTISPSTPGLSVSQPSGSYTNTMALEFTTIPWDGAPPGISSIELYDTDTASWSIFPSPYTIFISQPATLQVRARYSVGTVVSYSSERTLSYTIAHPTDWNRDSDNDGFPDVWEIAHGLNPLSQMSVQNLSLDSDGDGMGDIDELLRGMDPSDPESPKDNDGDGWSNWDEDIRGTDKDVADSVPVATRLYEVEVLLSGSFSGGSKSWANAPYSIATLRGRQLAAGICKFTGGYGITRIPMGSGAVVHGESAGSPPNVVAGHYLPAVADPSPADVGENWNTWEEWQTLFEQYLQDALVINKDLFNVTPAHYADLALLSRSLELEEQLPVDSWLSFNSSNHLPPLSAVEALETRLRQKGRNMNELMEDITAALDSGCSTIRSDIAYFADTLPAEGMEEVSGLYFQDEEGSYLAALIADFSIAELNNQSWSLCEQLDPNNDLDGDSIIASQEISLGTDGSNPFAADSDGDGILDDSDNCPNVANPDQRNYDADELGDLCDPDDDNDTLTDGVEMAFGSNPFNSDTDGDEVPDGEEWAEGTHPGISVYANRYISPSNLTSQTIAGYRYPGSFVSISVSGTAVTGTMNYPTLSSWVCTAENLLDDGSYNFTLTADLGTYSGFDSFSIVIDRTAPEVSISEPLDGSTAPTDTPVLSFSYDDGKSEVWLDGSLTSILSGENLPRLDLGSHTVWVEAVDEAGNAGFDEVTFNIDLSSLDRHISVEPTSVDFGSITGSSAIEQTITVSNQGQTPVTLGVVGSGNALTQPFSISNENCSGKILAFGETCTVTVGILLTADGTFSDSFDLPNDDPDRNPLTVSVTADSADTFPWLLFLPAVLGDRQ